MDEVYSSIQTEISALIKIEGSRFIADAVPVETEEDAKIKLETIRKKYFDATHHCYAFVIGAEKNIVRSSDDGEPSGTAGLKIHSAILAQNLSDILVVVTRYFGGTKLGVGGLGRAYFESAENALAKSTKISKALVKEFRVSFPFTETNPVMNVINAHKLKIAGTAYSEKQTTVTMLILPSRLNAIQSLFTNATRGAAEMSFGSLKTVIWS